MQKRKTMLLMVIVLALLFSVAGPVSANTQGSAGVMVNNRQLAFNGTPQYANGIFMVPAKEFIEALGGTFIFDRVALAGTLRLGENELIFRLDNSIVRHNGRNVQSPAPMRVTGYRYMVPAEFTAKSLGAESYMHTFKNILMVYRPQNGKLTYQVMSGDTLWILSRVFSTTIQSIMQQNSLTSDILFVGQQLVIKDFSPFETAFTAVTSKSATVFTGAGFNFGAAGYLKAGVEVRLPGKNGEWYKAATPAGSGYLHSSVVHIRQDLVDSAPNSSYFNNVIPVDTSKKFITYQSYTVQRGDSIWSISQRLGIPDYELAQANSITVTTVLSVGQVLRVPVHNIPEKRRLGPEYGEILDWFSEGQYVFPIGKEGRLVDLETGKSFNIKRTMGANHADCETLTSGDTAVMREIFGGRWSWDRRPFILVVDGRRFAVSVSGMPHAGIDGVPYLQNVDNRSDNWGYGPNYDSIAGNGMDGHFDVYFLNCLRHKDNTVDGAHQYRVLTAGGMQ